MSSPRLLVLSKHLLDPRDAQAQQSAALVNALSGTGARVDVIAGEPQFDVPRIQLDPSIALHALPARWPTHRQNLAAKIVRKLQRNLAAWLPTSWAIGASQLAERLMAATTYDALISVALPMESHIAAKLAHRTIPWLACMSDPWPESILPEPYCDFALPVLNALQKSIVSEVFATADALAFPCTEALEYLAKIYSTLDPRKAFIAPHVAPTASLGRFPTGRNEAPTLVHGGSLSRERVCFGLAEAFAALPPSSRWRLRFVGQVHPDMLHVLERAGAGHRVLLDGWRPKDETLQILGSAEALLLVEARMKAYPFLPSKLADYAATGRPILAITGKDSASARMIGEYQAGVVAGHDPHSILQMLLELESRYSGLSSRNLASAFRPESVASKYYEVIESLKMRTISNEALPLP